jgi:hypothetical protein
MMTKEQVINWLVGLPAGEPVWIDDGGLALGTPGGAYLEIGGEPEEEDEDDDDDEEDDDDPQG